MHARQCVAEPALSQHSSDDYEQDAHRRATQHQQFWSDEPLTPWQEFILCRELDCSRRSLRLELIEIVGPLLHHGSTLI
jgi:hypothetical protein